MTDASPTPDFNRIIIFDTTLRDGEQAPGASMTVPEKVSIAHQLSRLGVDVIEAGFPISSPGQAEAVRRIVAEVNGPTICEVLHQPGVLSLLQRIGPDVLRPDADPERAYRRIVKSRAPIGRLIMDQSVMAGIGNIYRTEILWRQGVHPETPGNMLDRSIFDRIWNDAASLLALGVERNAIITIDGAAPSKSRYRERVNIFTSGLNITAIDVHDPSTGGIIARRGRGEGDQILVASVHAGHVEVTDGGNDKSAIVVQVDGVDIFGGGRQPNIAAAQKQFKCPGGVHPELSGRELNDVRVCYRASDTRN